MTSRTHEIARTNPTLGRATLLCGREGRIVGDHPRFRIQSDSHPRDVDHDLAVAGQKPTCKVCLMVYDKMYLTFGRTGTPKGWLARPPEERKWPDDHRRRLFPEDYRGMR